VLQPDSLKLLGYNFAEKSKIFKFLLFFNICYAKKMTRGIARVSKLVYKKARGNFRKVMAACAEALLGQTVLLR